MPTNSMPNAFEASPFHDDVAIEVPVASPYEHWSATARAFAESGGLVSGDELAELLRRRCESSEGIPTVQPVSLVARWIVTHSVITLDSPWGRMLPLFQFDLPRAAVHAGMRPLLSELRGAFDDAELALWFVTRNNWLAGAYPERVMHTDLQAVRQAARSDRFVAVGF
ncbi:hypothetical protein [Hydrogenophaga sp.]|jgi:hypothetical protein|uniref:hypothetical protein n=1 Tax=Hydrogenophaga sp. TaxID=1904254 RepID=UPI003F6FA42E